jgi:hypothetical protein
VWSSAWDTLEVVRVTHSFLEWSALISFAFVVLCDFSLHFFEQRNGWGRDIKWGPAAWTLWKLCVQLPAFRSRIELKRLVKLVSLAGFAAAILLEIGAFKYSERSDELSDVELQEARKQTVKSLTFAIKATRDAAQLGLDLQTEKTKALNAQARLTEAQRGLASDLETEKSKSEAAAKELESEKDKRAKLAASLLPRNFWNQSGAIAKLAGLPPMKVVFEFTDEGEPRRTAEQINSVLNFIHWAAVRRCTTDSIDDGIAILSPETATDRSAGKCAAATTRRGCRELAARGIDRFGD